MSLLVRSLCSFPRYGEDAFEYYGEHFQVSYIIKLRVDAYYMTNDNLC